MMLIFFTLQKKAFDLLYKIADIPFLSGQKDKIIVSIKASNNKFKFSSSFGIHYDSLTGWIMTYTLCFSAGNH